MKTIALLLTLFIAANSIAGLPPTTLSGQASATKPTTFNFVVPSTQATPTSKGGLIETGNKNILINPGFEHLSADTGWLMTNSGILAPETTAVVDGAQSLKITVSSQTLEFYQNATRYASQFADGVQGVASAWVKTTVSGVFVCPRQAGSTQLSNCAAVNTDGKWMKYSVPYVMGGTSNGLAIVSGTMSSGTVTPGSISGDVYVDDAFVGISEKQSIQGSEIYGVSKFASDCSWARASASTFADFATDTVCTQTLTGKLTATAGVPSFTLPAGSPAGTYQVTITGSIGSTHTSTTQTTEAEYRLFDGTNSYSMGTVTNSSNNSTIVAVRSPSMSTTITLDSALSSATSYKLQCRTTQGANALETCRVNNGNLIAVETTFVVTYFPRNGTEYYSGTCGANCENVFSASVSTTAVVSGENVDWISSCTAGGTNNATKTCTLVSGVFTDYPLCVASVSQGSSIFVRMSTVSASSISVSTTDSTGAFTNAPFNIHCQKQGADYTSSRTIVGSFKEVVTAPGITKPKTCTIHNAGATNTTNCSASPCTEYYDSCGTVSACTRTGAGAYSCVFGNGTWAANSYVTCALTSGLNVSSVAALPPADANGAFTALARTMNGTPTAADSYFTMTCTGQAP